MGEAFELGSWAGKSVDQRLVHMCAGGASRWPKMVAQYTENNSQSMLCVVEGEGVGMVAVNSHGWGVQRTSA